MVSIEKKNKHTNCHPEALPKDLRAVGESLNKRKSLTVFQILRHCVPQNDRLIRLLKYKLA